MNGQILGGGGVGIKSIQKGTVVALGAVSGTATITAVDLANSILIPAGASRTNTGVTQDLQQSQVTLVLTNATTVTATRGGVDGDLTAAFVVIEFYPGFLKSVQAGVITFSTASATATITAVTVAKAFVMCLGQSISLGAANDFVLAYLTLTNTTTVTATHSTAPGVTMSISFMVVEFY